MQKAETENGPNSCNCPTEGPSSCANSSFTISHSAFRISSSAFPLSPFPFRIPEDVLLSVVNLHKTFELHLLGGLRMEVLEGLSFDIKDGEFGIIGGPSGSGKTTVLKCIYRSYLPTGGTIHFRLADGRCLDLARCPERDVIEIRKREIACVTQFLRCAPRVPAEEIVASARIGQGVERTLALEEARDLLERFRIPEKLWKAYPVTFSGGEQQRVNLARAIIQKPRLLLLDEPTASLDRGAIHSFLEALNEVRGNGTTCLAIFHDQLLVSTLATRVIELNGSRNEAA